MPKGHKRKKNAGVGIDFKRAKHKVGKKLPQAQNATDTTVKSQSITLPEQSVAADKTGKVVTNRNLTLQQVLAQSGHYNDRTRRDAITGMTEILSSHPTELSKNAATVIATISERFSDADAGCRSAALESFKTLILPGLEDTALQPFVPLLMAHICSALTHLAPPIRADAPKFLDALVETQAEVVAASYLTQVIQHFCHALARPARGATMKAGSLEALLDITRGLESFLKRIVEVSSKASRSHNNNAAAEQEQQTTLMSCRTSWPPRMVAAVVVDGVSSQSNDSNNNSPSEKEALELFNLLLQAWGECGVGQLEIAPDAAAAECASIILRCCSLLLDHYGDNLIGDVSKKNSTAHALVNKISPHFPLQSPSVAGAAGAREHMIKFNLAAAQILSRFLAFGLAQQEEQYQRESSSIDPSRHWCSRVLYWIQRLFAKDIALPTSLEDDDNDDNAMDLDTTTKTKTKSKGTKSSVPTEVYSVIIPMLGTVLPLLPPHYKAPLLASLRTLWQRTSVKSAIRSEILTLIASIVSTNRSSSSYQCVDAQELVYWIQAMPRYLWELGPSSPATSTRALGLLLDAARYTSSTGDDGGTAVVVIECLSGLIPQLMPLIYISAVSESKNKKKQQASFIVGPMEKLPLAVQELALDVVFHLPTTVPASTESLLKTTAMLCILPHYDVSLARRALDSLTLTVKLQQATRNTKKDDGASSLKAGLMSLLLTVISGTTSSGLEQQSEEIVKDSEAVWNRQMILAQHACRSALTVSSASAIEKKLIPPLMQMASSSGSSNIRASYGVLILFTAVWSSLQKQQEEENNNTPPPQGLADVLQSLIAATTPDDDDATLSTSKNTGLKCSIIVDQVVLLLHKMPSLLSSVCQSIIKTQENELVASTAEAFLVFLQAIGSDKGLQTTLMEAETQSHSVSAAYIACRTNVKALDAADRTKKSLNDRVMRVGVVLSQALGCELD